MLCHFSEMCQRLNVTKTYCARKRQRAVQQLILPKLAGIQEASGGKLLVAK